MQGPMNTAESLGIAFVVATVTAVAVYGAGCIGPAQCEAERDKLIAQKRVWAACNPANGDDDCIILGGQESDCTGVLKCDFAVSRTKRAEAERVALSLATEQIVCEDVCSK